MAALLEARDVSKIFGSGVFAKKKTVALQGASLVLRDDRPSITAIAGKAAAARLPYRVCC